MMNRRTLVIGLACASLPLRAAKAGAAAPAGQKLLAAARRQIGVTLAYDPAYTQLAFPSGDVPRQRGVCTDVVIRAYRDAFGLDLQALINRDMRAAFAAYPRKWALTRPDSNIDHRRVPNMQAFFRRKGAQLPAGNLSAFSPGDLATMLLPGGLPHIAIVSDTMAEGGLRALVHNIGQGAREEAALGQFPVTGRYRWLPDS